MGTDSRWQLMLWMSNWGNVEPHEPEMPIIWICVFIASYLICPELRKCSFTCQLLLAAVTEIKTRFCAHTVLQHEWAPVSFSLALMNHLLMESTVFYFTHRHLQSAFMCFSEKPNWAEHKLGMTLGDTRDPLLHDSASHSRHFISTSYQKVKILGSHTKIAEFERLSASLGDLV